MITIPTFVSQESFIQAYQAFYPQILRLSLLADQGANIINKSTTFSEKQQDSMLEGFNETRKQTRLDYLSHKESVIYG